MSVLDDLNIPLPKLLLVSQDLFCEYHYRKHAIEKLKRLGTHPAEIRVEQRQLAVWVKQSREAGMVGNWPVIIPA